MIDDDTLDPAELAPLVAALHASSGDARATILEALVRLPLAADDLRRLGIVPPADVRPLRPPWAEGELPGFARLPVSASPALGAVLAAWGPFEWAFGATTPPLEEEVAPAAVTRWFARAVGDSADVGLGNAVVGWVSAYDGVFRPDLDGLFAQYQRAALAECAAWGEDRRPGTWFLSNPDSEDWRGYRSLCWQIGWTVSRGGLPGLVPGLAHRLAAEDETERTTAALLIADAADYVLTVGPPLFAKGYGFIARDEGGKDLFVHHSNIAGEGFKTLAENAPKIFPAGVADPATLPHLLREAARAGVVPLPRGALRSTSEPEEEPPYETVVVTSEPEEEPPYETVVVTSEPEEGPPYEAVADSAAEVPRNESEHARPEPEPEPEPAPAAPAPATGQYRLEDMAEDLVFPDSPRRRGRNAALVALALLGGVAVAKWLFGWLTVPIDVDAPRLDDVQCTVFAPPAASPGSTILVQVFAHLPGDADDARAIATELDVGARRRAFRSLDAPVPVGSRLDFELRIVGVEVDDPVASLMWRGRAEAVQFGVDIPPAASPGTAIGTVSISRDGIPVGHVKFALAIGVDAGGPAAEPQGVEARRYRLAFVSYASQDRDEVLRRVQMLSVAGLSYFQDVLDLEPGEVWSTRLEQAIRDADVFLLFWSSHAKKSEWVRKEVDFALACKADDDLSPPEIRPVIVEGPPVISPWDDLAHLHFNDRVLYFMSRPG